MDPSKPPPVSLSEPQARGAYRTSTTAEVPPLLPQTEAAEAAEALRRHMEELRLEAGADPARLALQAIVLLADASPTAYLTEPHFHAAVEYARRGLDRQEAPVSRPPSSPLEARIPPRGGQVPLASALHAVATYDYEVDPAAEADDPWGGHPKVRWQGGHMRTPSGFIPGLRTDGEPGSYGRHWVRYVTEDRAHPPGEPPYWRLLCADPSVEEPAGYNVAVDLWRPGQTRRGAGIRLDVDAARALHAALGGWLADQPASQPATDPPT